MAIYTTPDDSPWGAGVPVTTQSMIKAFRHCPREVLYKFVHRLQPKQLSTPLTRGKWIHALLEVHDKGGDWKLEHKRWSGRFAKLFDEEKDKLGDLPNEIMAIMQGYFWHYGDPVWAEHTDWEVQEVEMTVEAMMPNGHLFRGRVDQLVRNSFGLWVVDHKTHKTLPDWSQRMFDEQSPMYIWACREMGIPVRGFIWNYLRTKAPSEPQVLLNGSRFRAGLGDTTYPVYARAVKAAQAEHPEVFLANAEDRQKVRDTLAQLKADRWQPDAIPTSPFYRRDVLEKTDEVIERVLAGFMRTSDTMHSYDWNEPVERNVLACKGFMCSYQSLSMADLVTGDSSAIARREYQVGDPLSYYEEENTQ